MNKLTNQFITASYESETQKVLYKFSKELHDSHLFNEMEDVRNRKGREVPSDFQTG